MRTERNQQLMCEVGLAGDLLSRCSQALVNERHPLHPPLQYIFERLAAQAIHPRDLRYSHHLSVCLCNTLPSFLASVALFFLLKLLIDSFTTCFVVLRQGILASWQPLELYQSG